MVKKVLVTGGNRGLGYEACRKLLEIPDMHVILGSRDQKRGEEAIKTLSLPGNEGRLELLLIDCGDIESIKNAASSYSAKHGMKNSLYCLVNNGGLSTRSPGKDVWRVNAGGPLFITDAFLPFMVEDGRVVNVGSVSGVLFFKNLSEQYQKIILEGTREELDKLYNFVMETEDMSLFEKEGLGDWVKEGANYYSLAKLLVCAHAATMARLFSKMKFNAIEPGVVETDMTKPMLDRMGQQHPFEHMGYPTVPVEQGVKGYMHLIVGEVGSGAFYSCDCKRSHFGILRTPFVDPAYEGP